MIKRIIIQRSLRSKSLQKITVENPYEIGLLLAAPPPKQGDRGGLLFPLNRGIEGGFSSP